MEEPATPPVEAKAAQSEPPRGKPYSFEEVAKRLKALSIDDEKRLRGYAARRMQRISGRVSHSDGLDLLQEAITQTLRGHHNLMRQEVSDVEPARVWQPDIPLMKHLFRSMNSIANGWARKGKVNIECTAQVANQVNPEKDYANRIAYQQIIELFPKGSRERVILEQRGLGFRPHEVWETFLALDSKAYYAAWKRIERKIKNLEAGEDG
jgi:hypothetical protein